MKKLLKFSAIGFGGVFTILLLIVAFIVITFNPNDYKPQIIKLVQDKKQRTLTIEGDIKLSFWPKIGANLGKVSLSEHNNPAEFAAIDSAKVSLALLPLLKKQLVVDTVYVDGVTAHIIKHKDGTTNFDDLLSKDNSSSNIQFDIDGVNVTNSEITYLDETSNAKYSVSAFNLSTGHVALEQPIDLKTDFMVTASQPLLSAKVNLKGNFLADTKAKHYVAKGLDATVAGDLAGGKNVNIALSGDVDASPAKTELLVNGLKLAASGDFSGAKLALDLSAPNLTILKDEVSGKKATVSISQTKADDTMKVNLELADIKGSPKAIQSSGVTGDIAGNQGKRNIVGKFSSPFSANLESMVFDLSKLAGNIAIKDPALPNGAMQGDFSLALHADVKKELIDSQFSINVDSTKLTGDVAVASFKQPHINFNINSPKLDLNKLIPKSTASSDTKTSNKPADLSALKSLFIDGRIKVGQVLYDKYNLANLSLAVKADGQKLSINSLSVKLDDSQINGDFSISQFSNPLYSFNLNIDTIDIDRYVVASNAPANDNKTSAKALDLSVLKALNADGKLHVQSLKYGKTKASNIVIDLKADGKKLSLNPLSAKVDDSQVTGNIGISEFEHAHFNFDLDIDTLNVNRYLSTNVTAKTNSENSQTANDKPSDLTVLKTLYADGHLRIGNLKYDKLQISMLKIGLKADGSKLTLNPLNAKVDESQLTANIGISEFSSPHFNFNVNIDKLDADKYITKSDQPAAKTSGDTPIDLSAIKKLNASGTAKIGWLKLANIITQNVNIGLNAHDGIATISPFAANLYQGSMNGSLKVDARSTPAISFKQDMKNIAVGPLLVAAINNDMLDGKGTVNIDVTTSGNTVNALKKGLNGSAALNLADGAIKGIDIAGSIRDLKTKLNVFKAKDAVGADKTKKTDFSELTATFAIKNGVAHNEDLAMKAPILRLAKGDSRGDIDIGNEKINYIAKPSIVKSLKGQGGADLDSLAGFAIPVKISGSFTSPQYGLDYSAIGSALAQSKLLDKVGGDKADAVKGLLNGNPKDALKGLLNGKKSVPTTTEATPTEAAPTNTTPAAEAKAPESKSIEEQAKEKAAQKLKKLFKF